MSKKHFLISGIVLFMTGIGSSQMPLSQQLASTAVKLWPDSFSLNDKPAKWTYDQGVILKGVEGIWTSTGEGKWFQYLQKSLDYFVNEDGSIKTYKQSDYNIDNVNNGRIALTLYRVTGKEKYKKAADLLRNQLRTQPRTSEGGFWHKKIYPNQMWLDGLYMAEPFYAEYAQLFHETDAFNDITRQFVLMESHARDQKTGLLYHGWDETKSEKWANKSTGQSPNFWTRSLGWYGMALVDALDYFPQTHPGRDSLIRILNRFAKAVTHYQDRSTGLWFDVTDKASLQGNYPEASGSSMLVYALAKGVRKGYLHSSYLQNAEKGYKGLQQKFIIREGNLTSLTGTVSVSGLGGNPYRDGSFEYYVSEKVVTNDPKGMGAFINAAVEMEMSGTLSKSGSKIVLLDQYFNNELKKDATGTEINWHYTWDDRANSGFSTLGSIYHRYGATLASSKQAPTASILKKADILIIVDPDTEKETAHPNFMSEQSASIIADWVRSGGCLLVFANDAGNCELKQTNLLTSKFGIKFNEDNFNMVKNDQFEQGAVMSTETGQLFSINQKYYIKELATLNADARCTTVLSKDGKSIAAIAKYGKGKVFVIGDPWIYNEYVDGRKLPADFDNYRAAEAIVTWSLGLNESQKK